MSMYVSVSNCNECANRDGCEHRGRIERAHRAFTSFMKEHHDLDFYGRVGMTCDYFFRDSALDQVYCCQSLHRKEGDI